MADLSITAANVVPSTGASKLTAKVGAGTTITAGQLVYQETSGNTLLLANALTSADTAKVAGIAISGGSTGQYIVYVESDPALAFGSILTIGSVYMLSGSNSGGIISASDQGIYLATGVAATDIITATGHDYVTGNAIRFKGLTGGAGLSNDTTYWVRDVSGSTFKVAATLGGAAINFTTDITAGLVFRPVPASGWYGVVVGLGVTTSTMFFDVNMQAGAARA